MNDFLEKLRAFPDKLRSVGVQKLGLSILCGILAIVLILLIFATAFVHQLVGKISGEQGGDHIDGTLSSSEIDVLHKQETLPSDFTGPTLHPDDVTTPTEKEIEMLSNPNVINIMLVGQDRRPGEGRQRSDSMILCSFNTEKKTFSMISFLRDTYVTIPGFKPNKINAAYAYGGMKTLTETLATNFGVKLDGCVEVDFSGFQTIIDMLGGVDITLTEKEANHLNEVYGFSLGAGLQHLNGEQALWYSRIRKIDSDSQRTARQRKVITALINAYKDRSVVEMATMAGDILDTGLVKTNMNSSDIINYVMKFFPIVTSTTPKSHQIPLSGTWDDVKAIGNNIVDVKIITDLDANLDLLKDLLG